jgi:hypothetical protein
LAARLWLDAVSEPAIDDRIEEVEDTEGLGWSI